MDLKQLIYLLLGIAMLIACIGIIYEKKKSVNKYPTALLILQFLVGVGFIVLSLD